METKYQSHRELVNEAIADSDTSLILVMGETRSGKTKFINLVKDSSLVVGNGLRPCTHRIQLSRTYVDDDDEKVILIDTPGLNNIARDDTEIVREVASFLADLHKEGRKLQGIIYVQSLSDKWKTATSLRNFMLFSKLCGSAAMANVVVVTTVREDMNEEARSALEAQLGGPGWCLRQWMENGDDSEDKQKDENDSHIIPDNESKHKHKVEDKSKGTTKNKVDSQNGSKGEDKSENKDDSDDADERKNTKLTIVPHKDLTTARNIIEQIMVDNIEMPLAIQTELCEDEKAFEETEVGAFLKHGTPGMESLLYEQERQIADLTAEFNRLRAELTGQKMGWGYSDRSYAPYTSSYPGYWGEGTTPSQHGVPCNLCGEMTGGAAPICLGCSNDVFWYYHHTPEAYFGVPHCPSYCPSSIAYWQPRHCCCPPYAAYHFSPTKPHSNPQRGAFTSHHQFSASGSTCAPDH